MLLLWLIVWLIYGFPLTTGWIIAGVVCLLLDGGGGSSLR